MNNYTLRPGVVLTNIHGVYLLISDRQARKYCRYIKQLNEIGAFIWEKLEEGRTRDQIIALLRQEYDIPENQNLEADVDVFFSSLLKNHYLITKS